MFPENSLINRFWIRVRISLKKCTALHHAPIIYVQTRSGFNLSSGLSFLGAGVMDRKSTDWRSFVQLDHKRERL